MCPPGLPPAPARLLRARLQQRPRYAHPAPAGRSPELAPPLRRNRADVTRFTGPATAPALLQWSAGQRRLATLLHHLCCFTHILLGIEAPGLLAELPGKARPQGGVLAVLVHIPALAAGLPDRIPQLGVNGGVVLAEGIVLHFHTHPAPVR